MTVGSWTARDRPELIKKAMAWLASPALRELACQMGGPVGAIDPDRLVQWSHKTLDTRQGMERYEAPRTIWKTAQIDAITRAAAGLGLIRSAPPQLTEYDTTVLLGGTTAGNRLRTEFAAELANGGVDLGLLALVTARRPISAHEHEAEPESRKDSTEDENLLRRVSEEFGPLDPVRCDRHGESEDWHLETETEGTRQEVRLLVAAPSPGRSRASTADGIRFLLKQLAGSVGGRTLLVTTAIYAPYQFFTAAPLMLSDEPAHVELVGTITTVEARDPGLRAQWLAQEIHAGINAAAGLVRHPRSQSPR
jgi:hypothetical protein